MNEYKLYQVLLDACVVTEWCCLWSVFAIDADNAYVSLCILVPGGGTTGTMGPSVIGAPSDNAAALLGGIVGGVVGGVFLLMLVVVIVVIVITVAVCLCSGGRQSTPNYNMVSYKIDVIVELCMYR